MTMMIWQDTANPDRMYNFPCI